MISTKYSTMANNKKYKILLVDDDRFLVDMYSMKFKEAGMIPEAVFNGHEALDKLSANKNDFDIILLDLIMPSMDGFELVKQIREKQLAEKSALIILSNQGQQTDIDRVEKYGVDGYIIKASTIPSEVLTKVLEIAQQKFR